MLLIGLRPWSVHQLFPTPFVEMKIEDAAAPSSESSNTNTEQDN